jgi:hypothetical protein
MRITFQVAQHRQLTDGSTVVRLESKDSDALLSPVVIELHAKAEHLDLLRGPTAEVAHVQHVGMTNTNPQQPVNKFVVDKAAELGATVYVDVSAA